MIVDVICVLKKLVEIRLAKFAVLTTFARLAVLTKPVKFAVEIKLARFAVDTTLARFAVLTKPVKFAVLTTLARFAVLIKPAKFAVDTCPARLAVDTKPCRPVNVLTLRIPIVAPGIRVPPVTNHLPVAPA